MSITLSIILSEPAVGNTDDMKESLEMMGDGRLNPSAMITHIGGLDAVVDTTLNLPNIPGGKKLVYNHKKMNLTAIADFEELGKTSPFFAELDKLVKSITACGTWKRKSTSWPTQRISDRAIQTPAFRPSPCPLVTNFVCCSGMQPKGLSQRARVDLF